MQGLIEHLRTEHGITPAEVVDLGEQALGSQRDFYRLVAQYHGDLHKPAVVMRIRTRIRDVMEDAERVEVAPCPECGSELRAPKDHDPLKRGCPICGWGVES